MIVFCFSALCFELLLGSLVKLSTDRRLLAVRDWKISAVLERLLVDDGLEQSAVALQVWDVQMQKHVSFAFKYEISSSDDLHSLE